MVGEFGLQEKHTPQKRLFFPSRTPHFLSESTASRLEKVHEAVEI